LGQLQVSGLSQFLRWQFVLISGQVGVFRSVMSVSIWKYLLTLLLAL